MKQYVRFFIVLAITVFPFLNQSSAEVLYMLNYDETQAAIDKYSTYFHVSFGSQDYTCHSLDIMTTKDALTHVTHNDYSNWDFGWYSDDPSGMPSNLISHWNTDVIALRFDQQPKEHGYADNPYFPTHVTDSSGKSYTVKYLIISNALNTGEDGPFPYYGGYYRKFEIPDMIVAFWQYERRYNKYCSGYSDRSYLGLGADTIVIGTSLRSVMPYRGCKVLYLKAGMPYHYGSDIVKIQQLVSENSSYDYGYYILISGQTVIGAADTIHNESCQEIHVPKGFRSYYLTDDEDVNGKIIDDLPVVMCDDIRMRRTLNTNRYTTTWFPYPMDDYYYDITGDTIAVAVGDSVPLDIVCEPYDATVRYSAKMSSSDESVATVDSLAMIRAVGVGTTVIKAEALDGSGVTSQIVLKVDTPEALEKPAADRRQDSLSDDRWYDLLGRPVSEPAEGIYIHRGRLEMVRR